MARFYNGEYKANEQIAKVKRYFSDLLFAFLEGKNNINAVENLARHLDVTADDVNEWLDKKALPNRTIANSMQNMIRGNAYHTTLKSNVYIDDVMEGSTWADIFSMIAEIENVQALQEIKITHAKTES